MSCFQCFRSLVEIAQNLFTGAQANGSIALIALAALDTSSMQWHCWHLADGKGQIEAFLTTLFTPGLIQRILPGLGSSQHPLLFAQSLFHWVSARRQKQEEREVRGSHVFALRRR